MSTTPASFGARFLAAIGVNATSTPAERVTSIRTALGEHRTALARLAEERAALLGAEGASRTAGQQLAALDGECELLTRRVAAAEELLRVAEVDALAAARAVLASEIEQRNVEIARSFAAAGAVLVAGIRVAACSGMGRQAINRLIDSLDLPPADPMADLRIRAKTLDVPCAITTDWPRATDPAVAAAAPAVQRALQKIPAISDALTRADAHAAAVAAAQAQAEAADRARRDAQAADEQALRDGLRRLMAELPKQHRPSEIAADQELHALVFSVLFVAIERLGEKSLGDFKVFTHLVSSAVEAAGLTAHRSVPGGRLLRVRKHLGLPPCAPA
jgi:hypothetical protein